MVDLWPTLLTGTLGSFPTQSNGVWSYLVTIVLIGRFPVSTEQLPAFWWVHLTDIFEKGMTWTQQSTTVHRVIQSIKYIQLSTTEFAEIQSILKQHFDHLYRFFGGIVGRYKSGKTSSEAGIVILRCSVPRGSCLDVNSLVSWAAHRGHRTGRREGLGDDVVAVTSLHGKHWKNRMEGNRNTHGYQRMTWSHHDGFWLISQYPQQEKDRDSMCGARDVNRKIGRRRIYLALMR